MKKFEIGKTYSVAPVKRHKNFPKVNNRRNALVTFKVVARVGDVMTVRDSRGVKKVVGVIGNPSLNCEVFRPIAGGLYSSKAIRFSLVNRKGIL